MDRPAVLAIAALLGASACEPSIAPVATPPVEAPAPAPTVVRLVPAERPGHTLPQVACRDGDGPWRPLTLADGAFACEVASGRYAVAFACEAGGARYVALLLFTVTEVPEATLGACATPARYGGVRVTVDGAAERRVRVVVGRDAAPPDPRGGYSGLAQAGTVDVLVMAGVEDTADVGAGGWAAERVAAVRGVRVDAGRETRLRVDLAADGVDTMREPVTVGGIRPDDALTLFSRWRTSGGRALLGVDHAPPLEAVRAPAAVTADDRVTVGVRLDGADGATRSVSADASVADPLAPLAAPEVTTGDDGAPRFAWPRHAEATRYSLSLVQAGEPRRTWWVTASPGYVGGAEVSRLDLPVLDVPGWDPAFALDPARPMRWILSAQDEPGELGAAREPDDATDQPRRSSSRRGELAPAR